MRRIAAIACIIALLAMASGCITGGDPGPVQTFAKTVQITEETALSARLDMGAGSLVITGGDVYLFSIDVRYTEDKWLPAYAYSVTDGAGMLELAQESNVSMQSGEVNTWVVSFAPTVTLALDARLGVGTLDIDLSTVSISRLYTEIGVGDITLDLRGTFASDANAEVTAGVGDIVVYLPATVGVVVHVIDGSDVEAHNLIANGATYTNMAYGQVPITVDVQVSSGVGTVILHG